MTSEQQQRRADMLALRDTLMAEHPEITAAAELAPLMGDLEQEYWAWSLERYLTAQDGKADG